MLCEIEFILEIFTINKGSLEIRHLEFSINSVGCNLHDSGLGLTNAKLSAQK